MIMSGYTLVNHEGKELGRDEREIFLSFTSDFLCYKNKTILYRGENDDNLYAQYQANSSNIGLLSEYLFVLGAKGKAFWESDTSIKLFDTSKDEIISSIWKGIRRFLGSSAENTHLFKRENEQTFKNMMNGLNLEKQELVLNYYYSYLHTENSTGSYFLSSSKDLNVANKFSDDGIIIVGWVPEVDNNYQLIRYTDICSKHEEIEKLGFTILTPQYQEEKEICLKCGMLPHFMLGYIVVKESKFVVNPAVFETIKSGRCMDDVIGNGLSVSQDDFWDKIKQSGYNKCYRFEKGFFSELSIR